MKKYEVTFSQTIYVEAKNEDEARENAIEEIGNVDYVGNFDVTNIEEVE